MTASPSVAPRLTINFDGKDHHYSIDDLPADTQIILQDMMQMDKELRELQSRVRQLQAARQAYASRLRMAVENAPEVKEPEQLE